MLREELERLLSWEERHRRLLARVLLALGLTLLVDAIGSVLIWRFESGLAGGDIKGYGDSLFFSTVQLLTVSSQMSNPVTGGGRIVDIVLEIWAISAVTAVAGSFASFFRSSDA